jgi:hypothetical protein
MNEVNRAVSRAAKAPKDPKNLVQKIAGQRNQNIFHRALSAPFAPARITLQKSLLTFDSIAKHPLKLLAFQYFCGHLRGCG